MWHFKLIDVVKIGLFFHSDSFYCNMCRCNKYCVEYLELSCRNNQKVTGKELIFDS